MRPWLSSFPVAFTRWPANDLSPSPPAKREERAGESRGVLTPLSTTFVPCIGTMNPPLTPPRRGTDRNACSPPGRSRGWVGSWKESGQFRQVALAFQAWCHYVLPPYGESRHHRDWLRRADSGALRGSRQSRAAGAYGNDAGRPAHDNEYR